MQSEQIDRRVKVTPEEVRQEIAGNHVTAATLADRFDVKRETIQRKIKDLREDNEPIIHTADGYILINREWLEDEDNASDLEKYQLWIIKTLKGLRRLATPIRPLLPQMRRTLSVNMSREERHELMQSCAKITALLAFTEVEDED
jgi:predicted DNA-binding transcriptional regulator YafY